MTVSLYRKYRPARFEDVIGQSPRGPHARERHQPGPREPRLSLCGSAGYRQDVNSQDLGDGSQLRSRTRQSDRHTGRYLRPLRSDPPGQRPRRGGDGRRLQPRYRRYPRPAGQGPFRSGGRTHEGVHRGRGPHAHARGLQRAAQDAGGAAGPRHLRAGHHRAAQGPGHDPVALPALRFPAALHRGGGRGARRRSREREAWTSPRTRSP